MAIKIKIWLDSGANSDSCYETIVTTKELGYTDEQWMALSEDEKSEAAREVAFERADWGYSEE